MPCELVGLQKRIYDAVKRAYPNRISTADLIDMVYSDHSDGGPLWARSSVQHQIFFINKKIAADGEKLEAKRGYASSGYRFVKLETMWDKPYIPLHAEG